MANYNISLDDDALAALDELAAKHDRTRSNMVSYMAKNWAALEDASMAAKSAVATRAPKTPKEQTPPPNPLPGADGKLTYMSIRDPRTLRPGSKWLFTTLDHLPFTYREAMPWAYPPNVKLTRLKNGKLNWDGDQLPPIPEFFVSPDDFTDLNTTLRVYKIANVPTEHRATTPKAPTWVQHVWNEALGQWVPDAADFDACSFDAGSTLQYARSTGELRWRDHHAYAASSVERLKELLTALEAEFSLTDDAKSFIGAKDAKNDVG